MSEVSSFASIISNVLTFVGTVLMMIVLNPWLTLITFGFLALMGGVVKVIGGRSRVNFQRQQAALGAVNGYIEEMIEVRRSSRSLTTRSRPSVSSPPSTTRTVRPPRRRRPTPV